VILENLKLLLQQKSSLKLQASVDMLSSPRQRKLATDIYHKIVSQEIHDDEASQLLHSTIATLRAQGANIAELSLLYCLESDYLFENKLFDDAYRWAMDAFSLDSERKEVLELMLKIHSPRIELVGDAQIQNNVNPFVDDERARECAVNLESLHSNDPDALCSAASCYSSLGLYDDALRILKQSFFKITRSKQDYPKEMVDEIKKTITQTFIDRYSSCDNDAHEVIIRYLIELVEWKYTEFAPENMKICVVEIWERLEYVLGKHIEKMSDLQLDDPDSAEVAEMEWQAVWNTVSSIPCSIPLSSSILSLWSEIVHFHQKWQDGVQLVTRWLTEYQMYAANALSLFAKFEKFELLYVERAKLYQAMGRRDEMADDIEEANTRMLCNEDRSEQITERNLANHSAVDPAEEPLIETVAQIKKRRASRISNVRISPMPKQYRDFHLTPKRNKNSEHRPVRRKRRHRSVASGFDEHKETERETEKRSSLESKNRVLENKVVDLKNDLHRESLKSKRDREEMARLQSKINELTADLNQTRMAAAEMVDTQDRDGEGDHEVAAEDEAVATEQRPDPSAFAALSKQNESYFERIEAMRREIQILRDCQSKMKGRRRRKRTTPCCNALLFTIGMLVAVALLCGGAVALGGERARSIHFVESLEAMHSHCERELARWAAAARPMAAELGRHFQAIYESLADGEGSAADGATGEGFKSDI